MGRWHASAVRRAGYAIAAVVDADLSRARALASRHGNAPVAGSLAKVAAPGLVVHICTPVATHVAVARAALEARCHVLVEKPVAPTAEATGELVARAEAARCLLVPVHQYVYQPGTARAARLVRSLGSVLHVDATICTAGADGRTEGERERLAWEVLPHPFSLLARLLHPDVHEVSWHALRPMAGELRLTGLLAGATVSVVVSTRGRPTRNTFRIVCERGTISLDLFHGYATRSSGPPTRAFKAAQPFVEAAHVLAHAGLNLGQRALRGDLAYPGLRELVQATYRAAAAGDHARDHSPYSDREIMAIARAMDAVRGAD
jgi:predicted dehydrogenase